MTTTYREYAEAHLEFCRKHNAKGDMKVYTSPMTDNTYHKEYVWEHGAAWNEVTSLVYETAHITVKGVSVTVDVPMWRTEYWSTESKSCFFYEAAEVR